MICPIMSQGNRGVSFVDCLDIKCAWFDEREECCAILRLSVATAGKGIALLQRNQKLKEEK